MFRSYQVHTDHKHMRVDAIGPASAAEIGAHVLGDPRVRVYPMPPGLKRTLCKLKRRIEPARIVTTLGEAWAFEYNVLTAGTYRVARIDP